MKPILFPAVLVIGLSGCIATSDLPGDFALDAKHAEGLALVSLTLSGKSLDTISSFEYRIREVPPRDEEAVTAKPYFDSATQHARWVQIADRRRDAAWKAIVKGPNSSEPLDILDTGRPTGRLAFLRLPAGEYEFHAWELRERKPYGGIEYAPKQAFSYRFAIKPGQSTYIGRLNLHLGERDAHKVTLEDRWGDDLALLRKKAPSLGVGRIAPGVGRIQP